MTRQCSHIPGREGSGPQRLVETSRALRSGLGSLCEQEKAGAMERVGRALQLPGIPVVTNRRYATKPCQWVRHGVA
jgi:hypothetical protein